MNSKKYISVKEVAELLGGTHENVLMKVQNIFGRFGVINKYPSLYWLETKPDGTISDIYLDKELSLKLMSAFGDTERDRISRHWETMDKTVEKGISYEGYILELSELIKQKRELELKIRKLVECGVSY